MLSLGISAVSRGDVQESTGTFPLRFYRTDLRYDAALKGMNDADTLRPDTGMTFDVPCNAHFVEFGETEGPPRGEGMENAVFMTGEMAERTARALAEGMALGSWMLKSGSSMSSSAQPYRVRHLEELCLCVNCTPRIEALTPPDTLQAADSRCTAGGEVRLEFSLPAVPSGEQLVGYSVCWADRGENDTDFSSWSEPVFFPCDPREGTLFVPGPAAGVLRRYRMAARGRRESSAYLECKGAVLGCAAPAAPLTQAERYRDRLTLTVTVPPAAAPGNVLIYVNDRLWGMTGREGGIRTISLLLSPEDTALQVTLRDSLGGKSEATAVPVPDGDPGEALPYYTFRGLCSADMGIYLTSLPLPFLQPRGNEHLAAGCTESIFEQEDWDVYFENECMLQGIVKEDVLPQGAMALLCGEGECVFSALPGRVYHMRIRSAALAPFCREGGRQLTLQVLLSPFWQRAKEQPLSLSPGENLLFNGGDIAALPLIRLQCHGNVTLRLVEEELSLFGAEGEITLDLASKTLLYADGTPFQDHSGSFFSLPKGACTLLLTGDTPGGELLLRERYL